MNYLSGFGNHFESESEAGTLPVGQNSPKVPLKGLVPEQLTGSAFTMDRHENLRSWFYRIHPSTMHSSYQSYHQSTWLSCGGEDQLTPPSRFRWQAPNQPKQSQDFVDGVITYVKTAAKGMAVHHYQFDKDMGDRYFCNADGELLFVPEQGALEIKTEFGFMTVEPQEIAVIPRGVKFQVNSISKKWCRGYLGENFGAPFRLPNLGPLGANALANPRDFLFPVANYETKKQAQLITKFNSSFWQYELDHSPLDVVAWHGNYAPYKYDLRRFNTMGTVSYDHPDPSIYTVLTSPSSVHGTANCDFVIFPPRWLVGENTFRPPYYHRNVMSEYMGLIHGSYDAKEGGGFVPGGSSLHNCMSAHGPDTETFNKAISNSEDPQKVSDTMAFMFETCHIYEVPKQALEFDHFDKDYETCWQNFNPLFGR